MVKRVNVTNQNIKLEGESKYLLNVWNTMTFCIKELPEGKDNLILLHRSVKTLKIYTHKIKSQNIFECYCSKYGQVQNLAH